MIADHGDTATRRIAALLDLLWLLRPLAWGALVVLVILLVVQRAEAALPGLGDSGCGINMSCLPPPGGGAASCPVNPNGNPGCSGAGNPVNVLTGSKYQREVDLAPLPGVLGLTFERHYNSGSTHRGLTGIGWRSSVEVMLVDGGGDVQVIDADGRRRIFAKDPRHTSLCTSARPDDGRVVIDEAPDGHPDRRVYRWQRLDGSEYRFGDGRNGAHPLQSIRAASGEQLTLVYRGGALDELRDAQGRVLRFVYGRAAGQGAAGRALLLAAVETPLGRIGYTQDARGRLATVTQPNGLTRRYHYEPEHQSGDPYLLTGISLEYVSEGRPVVERISTYAYDAQGRAVRTVHAGGDALALAYPTPDETVVTTSQGDRTVYRHAVLLGQPLMFEARGPGCPSCPPANVRYGYGKDGQLALETQLDARGRPLLTTRTVFDAHGRPERLDRIAFADGRAQPAQRVARAEYAPIAAEPAALTAAQYAAQWRPRVLARPSVVAGREHVLRIEWNEQLQTARIDEQGWQPAYLAFGARPIERSTRIEYTAIGGVSVPTWIEAGDTRRALQYDPESRLVVASTRNGLVTERVIARDAALRPATIDRSDGATVHRLQTELDFDGNLSRAEVHAWRLDRAAGAGIAASWQLAWQRWQHDPRGRAVAWEDNSGHRQRWVWEGERLRAHIDSRGLSRFAQFDEAGQLAALREIGRGIDRSWTYAYDGDRLARIVDAAGRVERFERLADGGLRRTDALGRSWTQRASASGIELELPRDPFAPLLGRPARERLHWREAAGSETLTLADGATLTLVRDDLGRELAEIHSAAYARHSAYDDSGRLAANYDGERVTAYRYDDHGRLIEREHRAPGAAPIVIRYGYDGLLRTRIDAAEGSEQWRFDALGRPTAQIVERHGLRWARAWSYDAAGRLVSETLPTGQRIERRYRPDGGLSALLLHAYAGGAPRVLVDDLQWDAGGIARARLGNGLAFHAARDANGRLIEYGYRGVEPPPVQRAAWQRWLPPLIPPAHASAGNAWWLAETLHHDAGGRVAARTDGNAVYRYGYDVRDRLIVAEEPALSRYGYGGNGDRLLAQEGPAATAGTRARRTFGEADRTTAADYAFDAAGRLASADGPQGRVDYAYDSRSHRSAKRLPSSAAERFSYDAQGRLRSEFDAGGRLAREYLYADGWVPLAALDEAGAPLDPALIVGTGTSLGERWARLRAAVQSWWGEAPALRFVLSDGRGAVRMVTDAEARVLWRAEYAPFGRIVDPPATGARPVAVSTARNAIDWRLRLPGQYEDVETGLYYNVQRYYDPAAGAYLTADPLGRRASLNPFSYVESNPLGAIDPLGLILFAFDGTGNTLESRTNVDRFRQYYDAHDPEIDGADRGYYIEGPGTSGIEWLDGAVAYTLRGRINTQLDRLDSYVTEKFRIESARRTINRDNPLVVTLDIVGFSRGAAAARDFANQVVTRRDTGYYRNLQGVNGGCVRVDLRFMGLFDTVRSTTIDSFNVRIPGAVQFAAQAVAVNEHRQAFPLESIEESFQNPGFSSNRIERGFVGAHSDIGGGYNGAGGDGGDLSDVALNWMVQQARAAGVPMADLPEELRTVSNPILHDERRQTSWTLLGSGIAFDREVRYPMANDRPWRLPEQSEAPIEGLTTAEAERFIASRNPDTGNPQAGRVDMAAYAAWLRANYGIDLRN